MAIHRLTDFVDVEADEVELNFDEEPATPVKPFRFMELIFLRLAFLLGLIISLFWAFLAAVGSIVIRRYWSHVRLASACFVGCLAGLGSPKFGISIICTYLLICSDTNGQIVQFLRNRFQGAFGRF